MAYERRKEITTYGVRFFQTKSNRKFQKKSICQAQNCERVSFKIDPSVINKRSSPLIEDLPIRS